MKDKTDTPQPPPSTPDASTLAHLAAQPRFAPLPPKQAVADALELLKQSQTVLDLDDNKRRCCDDALKRYQAIPQPNQWPATLNDFYRLIVRAKDETECQPRFKRFLRYRVEKEQQEIRQKIETVPERDHRDESTPSEFNTLKFRLLNTEEAVEKAVDRLFERHKADSFERSELPPLDPYLPDKWTQLAMDYLEWWEVEKTAAKARAGRERAEKAAAAKAAAAFAANPEAPPHKSKRKLTEVESLTKLAHAVEKPVAKKKRPPLTK